MFAGSLTSLLRKLFFLVLLSFVLFPTVKIHAAASLKFSWRGNTEPDLVNYRLYYGANSRFDSQGRLRPNFNYSQYIDFGDWSRCNGYTDTCQPISNGVSCTELEGSRPQCTVDDMAGTLYFSLTAYSLSDESAYTKEIKVRLNSDGTVVIGNFLDQGQVNAIAQVNSFLMKKNN